MSYTKEQVADAGLWLYMNREQVSEGWLKAISASNLVNAESMARTHDKAAANTPLAIIARLSSGDSENEYSEDECFVGEHLLQLGAEHVDDDANVYAATLYQIVTLLKNYGAPSFASPWRTDTPPYDVEVLAEFDMGSGPFKILATYVEQPILSDKPHGKWYDADLRSLTGLKRWMEIPA